MKTLTEIKDKLKKLMAKEASARDVGSLEEAEAFASKIASLIIEYELEIKDLYDAPEDIQVRHEDYSVEDLSNRHESNWIAMLYNACSIPCFCKVIFMGGSATMNIRIVGTTQNRELLHYMTAQLIVKLRELARISWKHYSGKDKRNTFIRSFYKGACDSLRTRLNLEKMHHARTDVQVNGLVIQKDRKLMEYTQRLGMRLGKLKAKKSSSADGFEQGREAGSNVSINKGMDRGKNTLLLN